MRRLVDGLLRGFEPPSGDTHLRTEAKVGGWDPGVSGVRQECELAIGWPSNFVEEVRFLRPLSPAAERKRPLHKALQLGIGHYDSQIAIWVGVVMEKIAVVGQIVEFLDVGC